ncbi:gamma-glutamylcyclotransferase family protein [Haliscomenobacter sp.]|uniref:gamma-glutamylcyclotransferase family protein n=1 Tax=Haliscomenobacter sp. TaxID=2717303 RepID=UPI003BAB4627
MACMKCRRADCMTISPDYCVKDWENLKNLPVYQNTNDWFEAIKIFNDRITNRFLKQVECLENNTDATIRVYSGFIIMSIDCLLVETLNQFYKGVENTDAAYKSKNWKTFKDFFQQSPFFQDFFVEAQDFLGTEEERSISKSGIFYDQVRCGLLHQAETKELSKINLRDFSTMVKYVDSDYPAKGIIVNRVLFHNALVKEFERYKKRLSDISETQLRENFIIKMNMICRTEKIFVFCYGSNMMTKRLQNRIKPIKKIGVAELSEYKFTFNKKSKDGSVKANLLKGTTTDKVWGVVFEINKLQKYVLDEIEGKGRGYRDHKVLVTFSDGTQKAVYAYISSDNRFWDSSLFPYDWYKEYVVKGADEHGLPDSYIAFLNSFKSIQDTDYERNNRELNILKS